VRQDLGQKKRNREERAKTKNGKKIEDDHQRGGVRICVEAMSCLKGQRVEGKRRRRSVNKLEGEPKKKKGVFCIKQTFSQLNIKRKNTSCERGESIKKR